MSRQLSSYVSFISSLDILYIQSCPSVGLQFSNLNCKNFKKTLVLHLIVCSTLFVTKPSVIVCCQVLKLQNKDFTNWIQLFARYSYIDSGLVNCTTSKYCWLNLNLFTNSTSSLRVACDFASSTLKSKLI